MSPAVVAALRRWPSRSWAVAESRPQTSTLSASRSAVLLRSRSWAAEWGQWLAFSGSASGPGRRGLSGTLARSGVRTVDGTASPVRAVPYF